MVPLSLRPTGSYGSVGIEATNLAIESGALPRLYSSYHILSSVIPLGILSYAGVSMPSWYNGVLYTPTTVSTWHLHNLWVLGKAMRSINSNALSISSFLRMFWIIHI